MKNFLLFSLLVVNSMFGFSNIDNTTTPVDFTSTIETTTVACTSCTKVISSQCGATVAAVSTSILASPVTGATNYRFEVTKGATVLTYETGTNRSFTLSANFPSIASYGTTYGIRVAVKIAGVWDDYGVSCNVSTPAVPGSTQVVASQCGITVANVTTNIFVNEIFQATAYRYEVTDPLNVSTTIDTPNRYFALSQIPSTAYSTTYSIKATYFFNGQWQPFGSACSVTTPASNTATKIAASQCGITVPTTTTNIFADEVFGSTAYRFEVTNGVTVRFIENATRNFTLSQLTGVVDFGTTYSIRVAVKFNNVWQSYGVACTITLPPLTSLITSLCGTTLPSVTSPIWARQMAGATDYRFRVVKGALTTEYSTTNRYITLSLLPGFAAYGTTYSVQAAYKLNGSWVPYGTTCTVTTPATPGLTKLIDSQCGVTLASVSTPIWANEIFSATNYRFEVTGANVNIIETTNRYFSLSQIPGVAYNTTYAIRVAYKFGGTWRNYGASCNVSTPATVTTTKLIDSQCGKTLSSMTAQVVANEVYQATDYRFEVTDGANVRTFDTNVRYFYFSQLTGGGVANTTYSVKVAVKFNSVWQAFGLACNLTTPAVIINRMSDPNLKASFAIKAFPNPYSSHFNIAIESASDEAAQVKVYDMIGRQLTVHTASVSEFSNLEIGKEYPVGVYNVIVSQGTDVKSIRMIKR